LSATEVLLLDDAGASIGSWPRGEVQVEIRTDFFGCLRLGKASVWVNQGDGNPLRALQEALLSGQAFAGSAGALPDILATELAQITNNWTLPVFVRGYATNSAGERQFAQEAAKLAQHNYFPATQSAEGGHFNAGRLILFGGLSVLAGQARSEGRITVTYQRQEPAEQRGQCWQCRESVVVGALKCRFCGAELVWPE
jgi:hypothetical protein